MKDVKELRHQFITSGVLELPVFDHMVFQNGVVDKNSVLDFPQWLSPQPCEISSTKGLHSSRLCWSCPFKILSSRWAHREEEKWSSSWWWPQKNWEAARTGKGSVILSPRRGDIALFDLCYFRICILCLVSCFFVAVMVKYPRKVAIR